VRGPVAVLDKPLDALLQFVGKFQAGNRHG